MAWVGWCVGCWQAASGLAAAGGGPRAGGFSGSSEEGGGGAGAAASTPKKKPPPLAGSGRAGSLSRGGSMSRDSVADAKVCVRADVPQPVSVPCLWLGEARGSAADAEAD